MRLLPILILSILCVNADAKGLKTEHDKTLYAIGIQIGRDVGALDLTKEEIELVAAGFRDSASGAKTRVDLDLYKGKILALHQQRRGASQTRFMTAAAKEQGVRKTSSGLLIKTLKKGTGARPKATQKVEVHYEGTLISGTIFDSSYKRGAPATFPLNRVIPCWTEGVQLMKVGETARLICPSEIAYGKRGSGRSIPPDTVLIFKVELLSIVK